MTSRHDPSIAGGVAGAPAQSRPHCHVRVTLRPAISSLPTPAAVIFDPNAGPIRHYIRCEMYWSVGRWVGMAMGWDEGGGGGGAWD
ncbi:MAG: hypothetical protein INR71_15785 [Terriglobus roseus]|nr:hypothetical protein [Terriglobus roseus]